MPIAPAKIALRARCPGGKEKWRLHRLAIVLLALSAPVGSTAAGAETSPIHWIESWGTAQPLGPPPPLIASRPVGDAKDRPTASPPPASSSPFVPFPGTLKDQTVRMIARTSVGGPRFRLEFSNAAGGEAVTFGSVHAALAGEDSSIVAGSDHAVTFGGKPTVTLFPGAKVVSDPVELVLPALTEVAVSIYVPGPTQVNTVHALGLNPGYVTAGDATSSSKLVRPQLVRSYFWLNGLSVPASGESGGTIVALGDSITDGYATTPGAHQDWPELLAERLQADPRTRGWGVVNTGISGNRILKTGTGEAAVQRFDGDVLARPGVKWVILLEGINDINMSIMPIMPDEEHVTAGQIIAGLDQLIERAHLHGINVAGGTVMATKGLPFYNEKGKAMWQQVNEWIRTSGRFDAVIDFDAITRDPSDHLRINPAFDPGDHVHPNDAGNRAMAKAIDLDIFR